MKKREKEYLHRPKPIKGFEFSSFKIPSFDTLRMKEINDEPNYLRNFALMMPTKAIKMPTKKQLKNAWYKKNGKGRILTLRTKPWQIPEKILEFR